MKKTILIIVLYFIACSKKEYLPDSHLENKTNQSDSSLLLAWGQANSGRWLPYTLINSVKNNEEIDLDSLSKQFIPINTAKEYYRNLIQQQKGLSDSTLDNFLDVYYYTNYTKIDKTLNLQKALDSLYLLFRNIGRNNNVSNINNVNMSYQSSLRANRILKLYSKNVPTKSNNNYTNSQFGKITCLPDPLREWFDGHYNNAYSDLILKINEDSWYGSTYKRFGDLIGSVNYNQSLCSKNLFERLFLYFTGYRSYNGSNRGSNMDIAGIQSLSSCNEMRDSMILALRSYYNCIKTGIPSDLRQVLSIIDPTWNPNIYVPGYIISAWDQAIINKLNIEDMEGDEILGKIAMNMNPTHLCYGSPNMGTWFYFNGVAEHAIIQLDYITKNRKAEREYWIPQASGYSPLNAGRADLANPVTGEIFEIKPNNDPGRMAGKNEANRYVAQANIFCRSSLIGQAVWKLGTKYSTIILPFNSSNNLKAELYEPGVILYSKVSKSALPQPIIIPQSVRAKLKVLIDRLKKAPLGYIDTVILEFFNDNNKETNFSEVRDYFKTGAFIVGAGVILGTILEDFGTGGIGIADDGPTIALGYRILRMAWAM